MYLNAGTDERRELTSKVEATSAQIWDQLRHVEGSLAQRLTLAETSHVAALQVRVPGMCADSSVFIFLYRF